MGSQPIAAKRRLIAVIVVVAIHALLVLLIQRVRLREIEIAGGERSLILVELRKAIVEPTESRQAPRSASITLAPRPAPPSMPPVATAPEETEPSPALIDWHGNALRSAEIVAGRGEGQAYRNLGPRAAEKSSGDDSASSLGPPAPKHKRGDVDGDVHGDPIVWVNSFCYMTLDKRVQTARDWTRGQPGQFAPAEFACLAGFGSGEPDGMLFEHIKKREDPPAPKEGTEMNALPERDH